MRATTVLAVLLNASLQFACDAGHAPAKVVVVSEPVTVAQNYESPAEQARFKEALANAGLPFTIEQRHGKEFVTWQPEYASAVARIQVALFGSEIPPGRNFASDGPAHERLKNWLRANGIPFSVQVSRGREYVVWDAQYTAQVHAWPEFPAPLKR